MEAKEKAISSSIMTLMRPLARILLRNGIPFRTFAEMAKRTYVKAASDDFAIEGRKVSVSRVSVITGLSRKEISRVNATDEAYDNLSVERYNRAARVITGWVMDVRFHDEFGDPKELPVEDGEISFAELVRLYSGDVPTRAILDELVRVGAVERVEGGPIRLIERAYIPQTGEIDKIGILGMDVADLISTIDHNLKNGREEPLFQRKVSYDNLPTEAIPELRRLAAKQGQELLEFLNRWMLEHDRDINPDMEGTGKARAGVGVYYFEESVGEQGGEDIQEDKDEG